MRKNITEALIEDILNDLTEDDADQASSTTEPAPDSFIDQSAASKFYAGLKSKIPFIDYENFHKAYDEAIKHTYLKNYSLFRDDLYEKGVINRDGWIRNGIIRYLNDEGSKKLRIALLTLFKAANQENPVVPGNRMHNFMVEWDEKLAKGKETIFKAALEKVKTDPKTADAYNEYVKITNNAPIDVTYKIELSYRGSNSITFKDSGLVVNGEEFYLDVKDLAPKSQQDEQRNIDWIAESIYKAIARVLYTYHHDNFKTNVLSELPIAGKYNRIYFIYNNELYFITNNFEVYTASDAHELDSNEATKIDFKNIQIVAIRDNAWGNTQYHGTYSTFGNTIYYDPSIDQSIGKKCGVAYKESRIINNGDTEVKFIPENEIPAEIKQLGLTKGETSYTKEDSSD